MNKTVHAITGFILGTQLSYNLQPTLNLSPLQYTLCVATVTLGSLLPDIDTPYSYLGRRFKIISYPLYKIFGHRTITHSLLIWTILLCISPIFNTGLMYGLCCVSIYGGVVSHLILDTISTCGVALLYPLCNIRFHLIPCFTRRNSANPCKTNNNKVNHRNHNTRKYKYKTHKQSKPLYRHKKRLPI